VDDASCLLFLVQSDIDPEKPGAPPTHSLLRVPRALLHQAGGPGAALAAAVVTTAVALVMAAAPARRGLTRMADFGAPPVRPAGGTPDRG
jgi:hypothetical protein